MAVLELRLLGYLARVGVFRVRKVWGVNSRLSDGYHFLMWDFDDMSPREVADSLEYVQDHYGLPPIYLIKTRDNHFQAICLHRCPWWGVVKILADTPGLDWNFVRLAVMRGYLTLRVQPEPGSVPLFYGILDSRVPETVKEEEIVSFTRYEKPVHNG